MRILSAYTLDTGERIWIVTEGDRSTTTLLLPELFSDRHLQTAPESFYHPPIA